jgi:hypothetical protein
LRGNPEFGQIVLYIYIILHNSSDLLNKNKNIRDRCRIFLMEQEYILRERSSREL